MAHYLEINEGGSAVAVLSGNTAYMLSEYTPQAPEKRSQNRVGLVDGGADILIVETIFDTLNAKAALYAIADGHRVGEADLWMVAPVIEGDHMFAALSQELVCVSLGAAALLVGLGALSVQLVSLRQSANDTLRQGAYAQAVDASGNVATALDYGNPFRIVTPWVQALPTVTR